MKIIYDIDYKGEKAWAYELKNIENGKWYIGISNKKIDEYDTSSYSVELRSAISKGKIEKHIIHADESYEAMVIWETEKLNQLDAENDDDSYNENNGFAQIKKLPRVAMMKKIADEIRKENSYCNIEPTSIDLTEEKTYTKNNKKGELLSTSKLRDQVAFQPRFNLINAGHLNGLKELIDQHRGNLNSIESTTGQNLLGVVLLNRERHNKPIADVRIDGNHTFSATVESEYGFELKQLYMPESMHSDWSDIEIRLLGEFLNPLRKKKTLETSEEDAIKTSYHLVKSFGEDSGVMKEYLNKHGWTKKAKDRIRGAVARLRKKDKEEKERPENFITYATEEERKPMKSMVEEYNKEPQTWSVCWSTGKNEVGDYVIKVLNNVYDHKTKNVKKVRIVLWNPTPSAQVKFKDHYDKGFKNVRRILKEIDVDFKHIVMPHLKEEAA